MLLLVSAHGAVTAAGDECQGHNPNNSVGGLGPRLLLPTQRCHAGATARGELCLGPLLQQLLECSCAQGTAGGCAVVGCVCCCQLHAQERGYGANRRYPPHAHTG
jgi:hypothetical protein